MSIRRQWILVWVLLITFLGIQPATAQDQSFRAFQDTLKLELEATVVRQISDLPSTDDLHHWFDQNITSLYFDNYDATGLGKRLVPIGVYSTGWGEVSDKYSSWNFGLDYQYPTKTVNAFMTVLNGKFGSADWWVKGIFGGGVGDVVNFPNRDRFGAPANPKVSSLLGASFEMGWQRSQWYLNPILGMSLVWVNPENDSLDSGQGNYLYVGDRLFLNQNRTLSLDLKGGVAMWRGFDYTAPDGTTSARNPDDYFASAGLTIHRDVNLGKVGKPLFGPLELGLMYTLPFDALETRILAPMRFYKELSLAPVLGFGPGIGNEGVSILKSAGLEIRMFGDVVRPVPSMNPYLGIRQTWATYDNANQTLDGVNAYLGSRFYFSDRFALDVNTGPAFWNDDPVDDGYIGDSVKNWTTQVGLSVALGKIPPPRKSLAGAIMTVDNEWGELQRPREVFNPLKADDKVLKGGEVRVYAVEEATTERDTVVSYRAKHMGDLSDLKYFSLALDLEIGFKPFNSKADLVSGSESNSKEVLLAILFNKESTETQLLHQKNTFFHFVDFDHGQYFGYRWDANRNRQPEYREMDALGEIENSGGQLYWGQHDEFVQPVQWLANDTVLDFINGRAIELRLLELMDQHFAANDTIYSNTPTPDRLHSLVQNYKIAYVKYPESTINKMRSFMTSGNFGVSLMVADKGDMAEDLYIRAKDAVWAEPMGMPEGIDPEAKVRLDTSKHSFYFSNPVRIEDIITDDMSLSGFEECSAVLDDNHRTFLSTRVLNRLWSNPSMDVVLTGYTDATPMGEECRKVYGAAGQKGLALARAQAAADYLIANGISAGRITVQGTGIKVSGRFSWVEDRSVDVKFTGGNR